MRRMTVAPSPVPSGRLRLWRPVAALLGILLRIPRNMRDRRILAGLSDRQLAEIRLARADVDREPARPPWDAVDWAMLERQRRCRSRGLPPWTGLVR